MSPSIERSSGPKRRIERAGVAALRITDAIGEAVAPGMDRSSSGATVVPDSRHARHPCYAAWRLRWDRSGGSSFETSSLGHRIRGTSWGRGRVVYLMHGWAGSGPTDGRPAGAAAEAELPRSWRSTHPVTPAAPTRVRPGPGSQPCRRVCPCARCRLRGLRSGARGDHALPRRHGRHARPPIWLAVHGAAGLSRSDEWACSVNSTPLLMPSTWAGGLGCGWRRASMIESASRRRIRAGPDGAVRR